MARPDKDSFNGQLAEAYYQKLLDLGAEARMDCLGELQFDSILHHGYKQIQELEPDLQRVQDNLRWFNQWILGDADLKILKRSVLGFCGIKVKSTSRFGSLKTKTPAQKRVLIDRIVGRIRV